MKTAVILCSGKGKKMWPYSVTRNKCMIPVSNKPIVKYNVEILEEIGFEKIIIVTSCFAQEIKNFFRCDKNVKIVEEKEAKGTAFSLLCVKDEVEDESFVVLYGDTICQKKDLEAFCNLKKEGYSAFVAKIKDRSSDHIGCSLDEGKIEGIYGHSREDSTHMIMGFKFNEDVFSLLENNSCRFKSVDVGMMPPIEGHLELTVIDYMEDGNDVAVYEAKEDAFDIDKPWQILEANFYINKKLCDSLTENVLAEGAEIHPTAEINGFVKLGKNSKIGRNVTIEGSIIVGDNTEITNAAILEGCNVIGNDVTVKNGCFVGFGSTIGDKSHMNHCSELTGILIRNVWLYHYMEIYGILGENVDIGAATVCGSLRFDDSVTQQKTNGRKEAQSDFGDSVFVGDYCRTGVNAILMPGVKTGAYSIVGPGVMLREDLEDNTLILNEQTQTKKKWSYEKYGW